MTKTVKILAAVFAISVGSGFFASANADMMKKDHMMKKHHMMMKQHMMMKHHKMMMKKM